MELAISKKQLSKAVQEANKWMPQEHYLVIGCDNSGCFVGVRLDGSFVKIRVYADAISSGAVELRFKAAQKLVKNCESRDQIRFCEPSRPTALAREVQFTTRIGAAKCDWVHPAASVVSVAEVALPEDPLSVELLRTRVADDFRGGIFLIPKWKRALASWETCFMGETRDGRLLLSDGQTVVVLAPSAAPKRKAEVAIKPLTIEKQKHRTICGSRALWYGMQSHALLVN